MKDAGAQEITIYLSSTYEDLKEYRQAVFGALRKNYRVIAMEDYLAADVRPVDKCLRDVGRSDIYLGIFAFRYGHIPPPEHGNPEGISVTELELRHAESLHIPCLCFAVRDGTSWPTNFIDAYTGDGNKGKKISRLRARRLREKLSGCDFTSPYQLASLVQSAVVNQVKESPRFRDRGLGKTERAPATTWDFGNRCYLVPKVGWHAQALKPGKVL